MTVLLTAVERSTLLEATPHGAVAAVTRQYELVAAAVAVQRRWRRSSGRVRWSSGWAIGRPDSNASR